MRLMYTLPSETAPQAGTLLCWPYAGSDWQPWLADIQTTYIDLITTLSHHTHVYCVCHDAATEAQIRKRLTHADITRVTFLKLPYHDTWVRDFGPLFVKDVNGQVHLLDFIFNGWGTRFEAKDDAEFCSHLSKHPLFKTLPYHPMDIILEGGSIEFAGHGPMITTDSCLNHAQRQGNTTTAERDAQLKTYLGFETHYAFKTGHLIGDDTDNHIDMLIRFGTDHTLAYAVCDTPDDPHYTLLGQMRDELLAWNQTLDTPYALQPMPIPEPLFNDDGERLPASYLNFICVNDVVLVPQYNVSTDSTALTRLQRLYPDHTLLPFNCQTLIQQGGALHCATMQIPKGGVS